MEFRDELVREAHHRCSNDLQMVVSLLQLMARQAQAEEARAALLEAANRVRLLSKARRELLEDGGRSLTAALRDVCEGLQALAEVRGIVLALITEAEADCLSPGAITAISLSVNELATNAIKHAYGDGDSGRIDVKMRRTTPGSLSIVVEDDGKPLPRQRKLEGSRPGGLGLGLARRLLQAQNGRLIVPEDGSKQFEIVLELEQEAKVNQPRAS